MKANEYQVLDMAVEEGVNAGINRAFKHTEKPTPEQISDAVKCAVLSSICEWFRFDDERTEQ